MQFKSGYIVDAISRVINDFKANLNKKIPNDQIQLDQINGLLKYVSSFDVEFPYKHDPDFRMINPVLATLNNIISRGLPTRAPTLLENLLSEINLTDATLTSLKSISQTQRFPLVTRAFLNCFMSLNQNWRLAGPTMEGIWEVV